MPRGKRRDPLWMETRPGSMNLSEAPEVCNYLTPLLVLKEETEKEEEEEAGEYRRNYSVLIFIFCFCVCV